MLTPKKGERGVRGGNWPLTDANFGSRGRVIELVQVSLDQISYQIRSRSDRKGGGGGVGVIES